MTGKILSFLLCLGFVLSLSTRSLSQDVLCIHIHEGFAHLENEHASFPTQKDEVHLKLLPDLSVKLFKVSLDINTESVKKITPASFSVILKRKPFAVRSFKSPPNPIRTIRLLI